MSIECDREGTFRAKIIDFGLREYESGAIAAMLRAQLTDLWDPETKEWVRWSEYDMQAVGPIWLVKKDGSLNDNGCQSLVRCAGWDGDFDSIVNLTWHPTPVQVVTKANEYDGNVTYPITFVNQYDREPGSISNLSPEKAKALKSRFGSQLRALVGTEQNRQAPKPAGKPPAPPKKQPVAAAAAKPNPTYDGAPPPEDEVPF